MWREYWYHAPANDSAEKDPPGSRGVINRTRQTPPMTADGNRPSPNRHKARRPKSTGFDLSDFDHRGELKTPKLLVVVLAFLSRYPVILALGGLSSFMLGRRGVKFEGLGLPPADALAASIPAVLVLAAVLVGRKAAEKPWARLLLKHGRAIAVATCAVQFAVLARIGWVEGVDALNRVVIEALLVGYAMAYLLRSEKVAYYFRTRSEPPPPDGT